MSLAPPTVVTELDAFELRGKMLLVNLTCATMLSKIDYLNEWDERKLRIIDSAWEVGISRDFEHEPVCCWHTIIGGMYLCCCFITLARGSALNLLTLCYYSPKIQRHTADEPHG